MKSVVCLSLTTILVVVISGISSVSSTDSSAGSNRRVARGFRLGAADRFSHGFGKRADNSLSGYFNDISSDFALPNEEFAELLRSSDVLARVFVQNEVDKNGDGYVTKDELLAYRK